MDESTILATEKDTILQQLADIAALGLGASVDMSENGRSINLSAARRSLQERLDWINQRLAQLSGPFAVSSKGVT